ncbi:hypothetical protein PAMP_006328 [Pampus punctatissimus]
MSPDRAAGETLHGFEEVVVLSPHSCPGRGTGGLKCNCSEYTTHHYYLTHELKKQLEMRRRQRAAHGVIGNHTEIKEEVDPVEENLREHIEQEKKLWV